jgi:3-oxoacyl-[acyl-carrier protein] reductase
VTVPQTPSGRSVLVTGGNRGIGLAIARAMADAGHRVTVTHRSGEAPEGLSGVICDVTDAASIDAAFKAVERDQGPVEVLVSNAGITEDGLLLRMSEGAFSTVVDANLTGSYRVAKRAASGMLRKHCGRMIFISSVVGLSGGAGQANYSSSKAGLVGLARSIARELGSRNITANVIAPGFVDTDMTRALPEARRDAIIAQVPLGRYASPDEIAAAVVFLASDGAGYISGAVLPVDGGLGMGH